MNGLVTRKRLGFAALSVGIAGAGYGVSMVAFAPGPSSAPAPASVSAPATKGRIPQTAFQNGKIDMTKIPDYVPVDGQTGNIVGYMAKSGLIPPMPPITPPNGASSSSVPGTGGLATTQTTQVIPVYGTDLTTVVGHMYPDKGFVPIGVTPSSIPSKPITVTYGPPGTQG